jgi:hypothetical protein
MRERPIRVFNSLFLKRVVFTIGIICQLDARAGNTDSLLTLLHKVRPDTIHWLKNILFSGTTIQH